MNSSHQFDLEHRLFKDHSQATFISDESNSGSETRSGERKPWSHILIKPTNDSIYRKPTHSYSSLISEAIRLSVKGQLTLAEIYTWLADKFPYFKAAGTGWKNSIRHTLSTNQKFVRVPRPAKESGKGAYWTIRDIDRPVGKLLRKSSFSSKPSEEYSSPRNSSTSGSSEYYELPLINYDFNTTRQIQANQSAHSYHHVYLPPFQSSDKNSQMGVLPTLHPTQDMLYGMDNAYTDHPPQVQYSGSIPRMPLSRESSSLFDDWTASSSISNFKLNPLNLNLPKDVESFIQNSS